MSQAKITPGATPSRRLNIHEFIKERTKKLDDNHTNLIIKKIALEKDLEHVNDQTTMHEGAVLFLNQIIKEWTVYNTDTTRLRAAEDRARSIIVQKEQIQTKQDKLKRKRKRKRK